MYERAAAGGTDCLKESSTPTYYKVNLRHIAASMKTNLATSFARCTANRDIPDGREPSGIVAKSSGKRIRDAARQEPSVGSIVSGKVSIPDGDRQNLVPDGSS
jgi:hypothetical protein